MAYLCVKKTTIKIYSDYDFILIGIVTPLANYRICWFINNTLAITLIKQPDLVINKKEDNQQFSFSRFQYDEPLTQTTFSVLNNESDGNYLLQDYRQIDYLLIIKGSYYKSKINMLLKKIKAVKEVQTAISIDVINLKQKNYLIF